MKRSALVLPLALALALVAPPARANCARPVGYEARVDANTVEITPINFSRRGCPDGDGLLREDVATHAVVRVDACVAAVPSTADAATTNSSGSGDPRAFVDACVPPGHYRYGFATPYACAPSACSTDYFVEVAVDHPLAPDCRRPADVAAPTPASAVPWGNDDRICSYGSRMAQTCGAGVIVLLALLAVGAGAIVLMRRRRRAAG